MAEQSWLIIFFFDHKRTEHQNIFLKQAIREPSCSLFTGRGGHDSSCGPPEDSLRYPVTNNINKIPSFLKSQPVLYIKCNYWFSNRFPNYRIGYIYFQTFITNISFSFFYTIPVLWYFMRDDSKYYFFWYNQTISNQYSENRYDTHQIWSIEVPDYILHIILQQKLLLWNFSNYNGYLFFP